MAGHSAELDEGPGDAPLPAESAKDWLVVVASAVGQALYSIVPYSTGVFVAPLQAEFGWSRAQTVSGTAIVSFTAFLMPFMGMLIDRWGPRRLALWGALVFCCALALCSMASGSQAQWWAIWALVSAGAVFISPITWMSAVAGRFNHRRGLAMALTTVGAALCSIFLPMFVDFLIRELGWRQAYQALACVAALFSLPILILFFRDPPRRAAALPRILPSRAAARETLLSSRFIRLATAILLLTMGIASFSGHFIPILTAGGLTAQTAAQVAGALGIGTLIGRLGTGFLLDRFPAQILGMITLSMPIAASLVLLGLDGDAAIAWGAALILGIAFGTETDILPYLTSRYFGLAQYGMILGVLDACMKVGIATGLLLAGFMFDWTGSYHPVLWFAIGLFAVTALLVGTLGSYRTTGQASQVLSIQEGTAGQ
ncbi:MFS transporter [soil metagenome]